MLLADIDLAVLSNEVIHTLIIGLQNELARRKALEPSRESHMVAHKFRRVQEHLGLRTYEEEIAHLTLLYGSTPSHIPQQIRHMKLKKRLSYLPALLAQDWTSLFLRADIKAP